MATENRDWGYRRIQGALANLGHDVARTTIANILQEHGLEPAPERNRKTTWKEFLWRHREVIVAADFFTIEAWTRRGLTRFVVLFLIDLPSRRVEIAGLARQGNGLWMSQIARNLTDAAEGFLRGKRYLIHDRDPLFTAEFLETLETSGVKSVKLPPRAPNLNAHAERFVRNIKETCFERLILFGEGSLRKAIHAWALLGLIAASKCMQSDMAFEDLKQEPPINSLKDRIPGKRTALRLSSLTLRGLHHEYRLERVAA